MSKKAQAKKRPLDGVSEDGRPDSQRWIVRLSDGRQITLDVPKIRLQSASNIRQRTEEMTGLRVRHLVLDGVILEDNQPIASTGWRVFLAFLECLE